MHLQVYGSGTRNKSSGLIRGFSRAKRRATVDAVDAVERNARRCSFFEHLQPAWVVGGGHAGTRSANPHCSHHRCTPCQPPPLTWRSARHPTLRRGARRSARRASGSPKWCCFPDGGGTSVAPNGDVSVDRRRHIARRVSRRFLAWACSRESETDELGARQGSGGTFVWEESMRFGS